MRENPRFQRPMPGRPTSRCRARRLERPDPRPTPPPATDAPSRWSHRTGSPCLPRSLEADWAGWGCNKKTHTKLGIRRWVSAKNCVASQKPDAARMDKDLSTPPETPKNTLICRYLQGNNVIQGFLRWCSISSCTHSSSHKRQIGKPFSTTVLQPA